MAPVPIHVTQSQHYPDATSDAIPIQSVGSKLHSEEVATEETQPQSPYIRSHMRHEPQMVPKEYNPSISSSVVYLNTHL